MRPEGPNWLATSPLNHLSIIPRTEPFLRVVAQSSTTPFSLFTLVTFRDSDGQYS